MKFRGASLVLASVHRARQSFLCRFLFDLCLVSVQLLRNLKLAFLDEINTICGTTSLSVDLLASDKLTWLHRLEDGLQGVTSEFGEDAEAAEKRNNLLELTLLLFLDGPLEVLGRECGKAGLLRALNRGPPCSIRSIKQGQLAE